MIAASNRQYEALSRGTVALARLRGGPGPDDLRMHKSLLPPREPAAGPADGGKIGVERWLAGQVIETAPRRVLDLGCGFGSFLATLMRGWDGEALGINASAYPVQYGASFWRDNSAASAPVLRQAVFGADLNEAPFDALIALESLGYSDNLDATLRWVGELMRPGGRAWILDDWAHSQLPRDDHDLSALCRHWHRSRLYTSEEFLAVAAQQGLELHRRECLTDQVPARHRPPQRRRRWPLAALSRLGASTLGQLGAAFLGGWHLENLYARDKARYELIVLERPAHD